LSDAHLGPDAVEIGKSAGIPLLLQPHCAGPDGGAISIRQSAGPGKMLIASCRTLCRATGSTSPLRAIRTARACRNGRHTIRRPTRVWRTFSTASMHRRAAEDYSPDAVERTPAFRPIVSLRRACVVQRGFQSVRVLFQSRRHFEGVSNSHDIAALLSVESRH
jgi:hypothetical protein